MTKKEIKVFDKIYEELMRQTELNNRTKKQIKFGQTILPKLFELAYYDKKEEFIKLISELRESKNWISIVGAWSDMWREAQLMFSVDPKHSGKQCSQTEEWIDLEIRHRYKGNSLAPNCVFYIYDKVLNKDYIFGY
jgi:hypothetical protein